MDEILGTIFHSDHYHDVKDYRYSIILIFSVSNGKSIQMYSALLLHLIQGCSVNSLNNTIQENPDFESDISSKNGIIDITVLNKVPL